MSNMSEHGLIAGASLIPEWEKYQDRYRLQHFQEYSPEDEARRNERIHMSTLIKNLTDAQDKLPEPNLLDPFYHNTIAMRERLVKAQDLALQYYQSAAGPLPLAFMESLNDEQKDHCFHGPIAAYDPAGFKERTAKLAQLLRPQPKTAKEFFDDAVAANAEERQFIRAQYNSPDQEKLRLQLLANLAATRVREQEEFLRFEAKAPDSDPAAYMVRAASYFDAARRVAEEGPSALPRHAPVAPPPSLSDVARPVPAVRPAPQPTYPAPRVADRDSGFASSGFQSFQDSEPAKASTNTPAVKAPSKLAAVGKEMLIQASSFALGYGARALGTKALFALAATSVTVPAAAFIVGGAAVAVAGTVIAKTAAAMMRDKNPQGRFKRALKSSVSWKGLLVAGAFGALGALAQGGLDAARGGVKVAHHVASNVSDGGWDSAPSAAPAVDSHVAAAVAPHAPDVPAVPTPAVVSAEAGHEAVKHAVRHAAHHVTNHATDHVPHASTWNGPNEDINDATRLRAAAWVKNLIKPGMA